MRWTVATAVLANITYAIAQRHHFPIGKGTAHKADIATAASDVYLSYASRRA